MTCGGQQVLTVIGGRRPFTWSIISGGGSLSTNTGNLVIYTAPSSNSNCANNPTLQVTDDCGKTTDLKIAVNCSFIGTATAKIVIYCTGVGQGIHCGFYQYNWDCSGEVACFDYYTKCCGTNYYYCSGQPIISNCSAEWVLATLQEYPQSCYYICYENKRLLPGGFIAMPQYIQF
jgi:hypothetical protein